MESAREAPLREDEQSSRSVCRPTRSTDEKPALPVPGEYQAAALRASARQTAASAPRVCVCGGTADASKRVERHGALTEADAL